MLELIKDAKDRDTVAALSSNLTTLIGFFPFSMNIMANRRSHVLSVVHGPELNSILLDRLIIRQSTPRQNRSPEDGIGRIFLEMVPPTDVSACARIAYAWSALSARLRT